MDSLAPPTQTNASRVICKHMKEVVETKEFNNGIGCGFETAARPMCDGTENTLTLAAKWLIINDVIPGAL